MRAPAIAVLIVATTAGAAHAKPLIAIAPPHVVTGTADAAAIAAALEHSEHALLDCYAKEFMRPQTAPFEGVSVVTLEIGETGKLASEHAAGLDNAAVETCLERVAGKLVFARAAHGATVRVPILLYSSVPIDRGPFDGGAEFVSISSGVPGPADRDAGLGAPSTAGKPPAAGPPPHVMFGRPAVIEETGDLDRGIIRRYVRRAAGKLAACSAANGHVVVDLVIAAGTGVTTVASVSGLDAKADACIHDVIAAIQFPSSKHDVEVAYPLTFQ